ncbi:MAG: PKD domain-containing protein [Gemmatimonadaceae bacterium]
MRHWLMPALTLAGTALCTACSADPSAPLTSTVTTGDEAPLAALVSPIPVTTRGSVTRRVGNWDITITDLGLIPGGLYSSAHDINNLGEVVGIAADATGNNRRVVWANGTIVDTLAQPGSAVTTYTQMNESRQFIGFSNQGSGGIGYGSFNSGGIAVKLAPFPGTAASGAAANGINALGEVAGGGSGGGTTEPIYRHAGIWRNGVLARDLGTMAGGSFAMAYDINDVGQVTGTGTLGATGAREYAWRWQNGTYTILPDLPGAFLQSSGRSINARGDVAGQSNGGYPVVWVNGVVKALPLPSPMANRVYEINDAGDVVGTVGSTGVLWRNGEYIPLAPWPNATVNTSVARGINNNGVVVGESYFDGGGVHAVAWTVVPAGTGGGTVNTPPTATLAATTSTSIRRGQSLTIRATVTDPDAGDGPWPWSIAWGNGTTSGTRTAPGSFTVSRSYTATGTYSVRMTVTDARGARATSNAITVRVR